MSPSELKRSKQSAAGAPGVSRDRGVSEANATLEEELDVLCINTICTLSMDAVQAANSGHPGTPMSEFSSKRLTRNLKDRRCRSTRSSSGSWAVAARDTREEIVAAAKTQLRSAGTIVKKTKTQ
jgi:hypothetical protein